MKTKFYLAILLSVLVVSSCSKEDDDIPSPTPTPTPVVDGLKEITFYVTLPQVLTRASMEEDGTFVWNAGDAISVFDGVANREFKTTQSGEKVAFTGKVKEAANYYIVYPYQSNITVENGVIKGISLPSTQKAIAGGIDPKLNVSVGTMKSGVSEVSLSNVFAYSRFIVDGEQATNVRSITISANDDTALSGAVTVDMNTSTPRALASSSASKSITLTADNGLEVGRNYYVALMPSVLSNGISMTFTDQKGDSWTKKISSEMMMRVDREAEFIGRTDLRFLGDDMIITNQFLISAIEAEMPNITKDENGYISLKLPENSIIMESLQRLSFEGNISDEDSKSLAHDLRYLTYLSTLELNNFTINYLDLTGLAHLGFFYAKNTEIETLNLSGSKYLTRFLSDYRWDNNHVTINNLDLSDCLPIKKLNLDDIHLTNLNLSGSYLIEEVYCAYNNLSELDLSGLASLKSLDCSDNRQLSKLYMNDCTSLEILNCGFTQLSNIDFSSFTNLRKLDCYSNNIQSIDITNNTLLEYLTISSIPITSLNLKNNTKLNTVSIDNVSIQTLDFSNNNDLQQILCISTSISEIDLSNKINLKEITIRNNINLTDLNLKDCTSLKRAYCEKNILEDINLIGCSSLESLGCPGNHLNYLDLRDCISIQTVDLDNNDFSGSLNLSGLTSLVNLHIGNNHLKELDVSNCTSLSSLTCAFNEIEKLSLTNCTSLSWLDCSYNKLNSINLDDCKSLYRDIYVSYNRLKSIDLSKTNIQKNISILSCSSCWYPQCDENGNPQYDESGCYVSLIFYLGQEQYDLIENKEDCYVVKK